MRGGETATAYSSQRSGLGLASSAPTPAGLITVATDVDHIVRVSGPDDPRFFDETAVQSLCHACHARKTAMES